jgi:PPP family 3-phenylpropionic acid transporter
MSYLSAASLWPLLAVSLLHAAALAPTTNLADALALLASRRGRPLGFEYGWVRGAGSAAFIVASIIAGWAIGRRADRARRQCQTTGMGAVGDAARDRCRHRPDRCSGSEQDPDQLRRDSRVAR